MQMLGGLMVLPEGLYGAEAQSSSMKLSLQTHIM